MTELNVEYLRFRVRAYTRAEWESSNGILLEREVGLVLPDPTSSDDHAYRCKLGLGDNVPWNDKEYVALGLGEIDLSAIAAGHSLFWDAANKRWVTGLAGNGLAFAYTADTGSTADSDPTDGLIRWDNATQTSATHLYVDDVTADSGIDLSTLFGSLGGAGFVHIVHASDPSKWQVWKWSALVDGTGYWKFTVALQVNSASFTDADPLRITFVPAIPTLAAGQLLGRGASSGSGSPQPITLGSNLSMVANVLAATGSGGSSGIDPHTTAYKHDEFEDFPSGTWQTSNAAGSTAPDASATLGRPGVVVLSTASSSSGIGGILDSGIKWLLLGAGAFWVEYSFNLPILSDGTNRFSLVVGLRDVGANTPTDQLGLLYTDNVNSGNWVIRSVVGGVTTDVNASSGPAAATQYRLRIEVNAAGTSAEFFINGASIGTTTAIPTAALRRAALIVKSVGVSARTVKIDYSTYSLTLTTTR